MALARSCRRESLAACSRIQASRSSTSGRLSVCRTAGRSVGALAVDRPLDLEQRVDPADHFDRDGRERGCFLPWALRRAFSSRSAMAKNGRLAWTQHAASWIVPGCRPASRAGCSHHRRLPAGSRHIRPDALRVLALAVARVIEHRRRRSRSAKRPVVPNIDPETPRVGLALGQDRHNGVVAMQALGAMTWASRRLNNGIKHERNQGRPT